MEHVLAAMQELVVANHILANEGVCDAFGHASIRHPDNPELYIMARSRDISARRISMKRGLG